MTGLLVVGIRKMKVKRMSKMMLQNSVFVGTIIMVVMILIKLKKSQKEKSRTEIRIALPALKAE